MPFYVQFSAVRSCMVSITGTADTPRACWSFGFGVLHRFNPDRFKIDGDRDNVVAAAEDHAADWADIAEIAAPAEQDVLVLHHDAVGWIDVHPAKFRTQPAANPGVRLVRALAFRLARRWLGADVARGV